MRLLLDKNLSFRLVALLEAGGHDVVHVDDLDLEHADDAVILERARELDRVVVSSDTDFGAPAGGAAGQASVDGAHPRDRGPPSRRDR